MTKKNIILIDRGLRILDSVYRSQEVNIKYLITDYDTQVEEIKKVYDIDHVFAATDSLNAKLTRLSSDFDYELIEKFKATQLKSEHFHDRFSDDTNLIQYYYFCALSFWSKVFSSEDISAVVLDGVEHGANYDNLILDVAKFYGVNGYLIEGFAGRPIKTSLKNEVLVSYPSVSSFVVRDYKTRSYVPIDCQKFGLAPTNLDNYLFYLDRPNFKLQKESKDMARKVISILASLKSRIPYGYFMAFKCILFGKLLNFYNVGTTPFKLLDNISYAKKIKSYYNSIAVEFDPSQKSVFYAMHFEPEASITVRTRLSSQLMIIKILSQSLPNGWILYIKEHPDQFETNRPGFWFFLITIHKFRTKKFYNEILKFDNVKLLKTSIKSKEIIQKSKAVASINGTIALETISFKKPLILFGHESTPVGLCNDVLKVASLDQCVSALEKIKGGYFPMYSDFREVIEKYAFEASNFATFNAQPLVDYLVCSFNSTKNKHET